MPFCSHGEPDHLCGICQAPRRPDGIFNDGTPKPVSTESTDRTPTVTKPPQKVATKVTRPPVPPKPDGLKKTPTRSRVPGKPSSIVPNGVSKPGPVASGSPPTRTNPAVRGGGVKVDDKVIQEFWKNYKLLGVTDESAEKAVQDELVRTGEPAAPGFDTLELAERFALYKYTSSEYLKWNGYLRTKKGSYQAHCDLVSSALSKLQKEDTYATTYRIERFSDRRHPALFTQGSGNSGTVKKGHVIEFSAFTSTAFNIGVIESDPQFKGAGAYIKYIMTNHAAKRVNFLSLKPLECELIVDRGAKFKIIDGPEQKFVFDKARRAGAIEIYVEQVL